LPGYRLYCNHRRRLRSGSLRKSCCKTCNEDVLVNKLRRKLEANPQKPEIIKTARGIGYRLGVPVQQLTTH